AGRDQPFLSYVVAVDRDNNSIALDELVPESGGQALLAGDRIHVEAMIDGVRLNWSHQQKAVAAQLDGNKCYWLKFPEEIRYHQRRGTFRANVLVDQPATIQSSAPGLNKPLEAKLLDISA